MYEYLPYKVDIDKLISVNHPEIPGFHRDKLVVIGSMIASTIKNYDGFAEIYSAKFQSLVYEYRQYLDYFENNGIIEIDNQFFYDCGSKVRGYRFSEDYNTTVQPIEITYWPLVKKQHKIIEHTFPTSQKYNHLIRQFNRNLCINHTAAEKYLKYEYALNNPAYEAEEALRKDIESTWYENYADKLEALNRPKIKNPVERFNSAFIILDKFRNREYGLKIDNTVGRFHSTVTRLPRDLRNFVTFEGKELVCIDIKNCLPYLSLIILDRRFWENRSIHPFFNFISSSTLPLVSFPITILVESLQKIDKQELNLYKDLVIPGKIYDYIWQSLDSSESDKIKSRKELKQQVFKALFSGNQFLGQKDAYVKRIFKELFPGIYDFFALLKKDQKELLPILLMRIESKLMLEVITRKISTQWPNIPFYTIHDGIATNTEFEDVVKKVLIDEMLEFVGYPVSLSVERWNETNLNHYKSWNQRK